MVSHFSQRGKSSCHRGPIIVAKVTQAVVAHKSSTGLKYNKHVLVSNVSPVGSGCGIGGFFAPFMGPG